MVSIAYLGYVVVRLCGKEALLFDKGSGVMPCCAEQIGFDIAAWCEPLTRWDFAARAMEIVEIVMEIMA